MKTAHKSHHFPKVQLVFSGDEALGNVYLRQILVKLLWLEKTVARLRSVDDNRIYLKRVAEIARSIYDLASVHGFAGMEKIAHKLFVTFTALARSGSPTTFELVHKLGVAIETMRQVAEMESKIEQQMTVERVSRLAELNQERIQDCARRVTNTLDDLLDETHREHAKTDTTSEPVFDIAEPDSVLHLSENGLKPDNNG